MNVNNQMYRMFKEMKEGYAKGNPDQLEHGARCWLDLSPENPFPAESPEFEAFFQMQKCYSIWKRGDIDRKINRRRMISWAEKLCEINPRQPYKFDKKAEEEELKKAQEEEAKKIQKEEQAKEPEKIVEIVKPEEPVKMFGVIPEEKKGWFKSLFSKKKEGVQDDSPGAD